MAFWRGRKHRVTADLVENRICSNVVDLTASICPGVCPECYDWETAVCVRVSEDDATAEEAVYVMDEMIAELGCDESEVVWAMTCIRLCCEEGKLVAPEPYAFGSKCARILRCAETILDVYGREAPSGPPDHEEEDVTEAVNAVVEHLLRILRERKEPHEIYTGIILYSYADRHEFD